MNKRYAVKAISLHRIGNGFPVKASGISERRMVQGAGKGFISLITGSSAENK